MDASTTWVGIDAHKKTLAIAVLTPNEEQPHEFVIENTERAIKKLVRQLERDAPSPNIRACYEADTCGYTLQRRLHAAGDLTCDVIAPSLVPCKPGQRIKTDRRDARQLAELHRAGVLTAVVPPSPEQEAVRDLCRCRDSVRVDLGRCRHRLQKMLVRRGFVFKSTSRMWSQRHRTWLQSLVFENEIDRVVAAEYLLAIDHAERRLRALSPAPTR